MASIIVDLSDDIKKMQSLKEEIQQVKKELGSINVKVELDIKRDMEARLKSLTDQYDALVQKVAQTDAKIAESAARINKSAEAVIRAQEQMAKAASGQSGSSAQGASSGNTASNNAQTASVEAQAKAYDELKDAIEGYLGTMEGNARYIAETETAIKNVRANISLLNKEIKSKGGIANESQLKNLAHYTEELERLKIQLQDARRDFKTDLRINIAGEGSLAQLRNQLLQMQRVWDGMVESVRNSPIGQEFAKSIDVLNKQVSELEQTMGRYQRNVGNYASGWNGLNMSIQQIGRELPSLAMGWNTFFLAISNNLPILTDEIKRAKDEYNNLKKAGQDATPVWKQVVSSLISWQTALTVGITLLTMYGEDILKWVGNLFKAKDGTVELEEATKRLNTAVSGVYGSASEEMRVLRDLNESLENATRGTEEWNQIRNKIVTGYSKYLPSIDKEIEKTGTLAGSYDKLAESIQKAAAARGFEELKSNEDKKYADSLIKTYQDVSNRLVSLYGEEQGRAYFEGWKKWLERLNNGEEISSKVQGAYGNVSMSSWNPFNDDTLNSLMQDLNKQYKAREKALDEYRKIFGITEGTEDNIASDSIKALRDRITAQREALEKLSTSSEEYKNLLASIQKDEQKLSMLTSSPKDINKSTQSIKDYLDELSKLREENEGRQVELMEDGTDKQIAEINRRYEKEIAEVKKLEGELRKSQGGNLTEEQQGLLDSSYSGIKEKREKEYKDLINSQYEAEREAMRDYLKEYGTYQQQKLAIAQEYAEKIAKAQSEGERTRLKAERERTLSGMDAESLRMSIDWPLVFGEFGGMFEEIMRPTLEKAKQYMQTDDFRKLQPSDQSSITEAVNKLEQALGGADKVSFKQLGKDVKTLQKSMLDLDKAKQQEAESIERLSEAQEAYEKALASGTDEEKDIASLRLSAAKDEADSASENVRKQEEITNRNNQIVTGSAATLKSSMENVTEGLQKLASGGIKNAYDGLIQLGLSGKLGGKMSEVAKTLNDVPIIGWIISIIDVFKDGLSDLIGGLLDGIFNAISGIIGDILNFGKGGLWETIGSSIIKGVGNIFNAITFGGFNHWGNNVAETKATIERLTNRNEALISSIDRLNDTMTQARGMETVKAAEQAVEHQKELNENYRDIAAAQAHYQGKHHSWSKYFNDWIKGVLGHGESFNTGHAWKDYDVWERMNEIAGFEIKSRNDFLSITPEQMADMLADVNIRELIKEIGEGGYGEKMLSALEDYANQAGKIDDLNETLKETLTQVSFDSLYDSFIDTLMDMDASAEDFSDNFSEYLMRAVLSNKVGEAFSDRIQQWYDDFAEAMKNDGSIDDNELKNLKSTWNGIVNDGLELRDELAAATGYEQTASKKQQSASSGGFDTMTQDQAPELSGRFTAVAESNYRIENATNEQTAAITMLTGTLSALTGNANDYYNIADETRSIIAQSYLELQQISENTGSSAKYLKDIKDDISIVKQNTSRL